MTDVTMDELVTLLAPMVDTPAAVAVYVTRAFNDELGRHFGFELPDDWGRWAVSCTMFPAHVTMFGVPVVVNDAMATVGGRPYEVRWRQAPVHEPWAERRRR